MKLNHIVLKKFKNSFRYNLFFFYMSYLLRKMGISISPYYLNREELHDSIQIKVNPSVEPVTLDLLSREEVEYIFNHPETKSYVYIKDMNKDDNTLCAALKHNNDIMAFVFVNLTHCRCAFSSFNLKEDEAYLFAQYTYFNYRGKNLAPYLRQRIYRHLLSLGRTRLYSVTEYLNTSAVTFKSKLEAKPIKLELYVNLFNRYARNFTLKNYIYSTPQSKKIDYVRT